MTPINDTGYAPNPKQYKNRLFPEGKYHCDKCGEKFPSYKELRNHKKEVHSY